MNEVAPAELKKAVESQHGGTATLVQSVPVDEHFQGQPVWRGTVHVFELKGHETAKRAYAWSYELPDGKRRFFAVLHVPPIDSPAAAVRAAIVAEDRAKQEREWPADARPTCIHCGLKFDQNAGRVTDEVAVCDVCLGD